MALVTGPNYLLLTCFDVMWVVEALLTTLVSTHIRMGELTVGGVLASLSNMVKEQRLPYNTSMV